MYRSVVSIRIRFQSVHTLLVGMNLEKREVDVDAVSEDVEELGMKCGNVGFRIKFVCCPCALP